MFMAYLSRFPDFEVISGPGAVNRGSVIVNLVRNVTRPPVSA